MQGNKRIKRLMFKAIGFAAVGISISMLILSLNTLSLFGSNMFESIKVNAAETQDIIEHLEMDKVNPEVIKMKRSKGLEFSPVVFFSVEGDAADYIVNLNPVKLESNKLYKIPIKISIDLLHYLELTARTDTEPVSAVINVKYLNNFIDESIQVSFTKEYLIRKFQERVESGQRRFDKSKSMVGSSILSNLIVSIAKYRTWEKVSQPPQFITDDQDRIMKATIPRLNEYIVELDAYNKHLISQIEEKNRIINSIKNHNERLERELDEAGSNSDKGESSETDKKETYNEVEDKGIDQNNEIDVVNKDEVENTQPLEDQTQNHNNSSEVYQGYNEENDSKEVNPQNANNQEEAGGVENDSEVQQDTQNNSGNEEAVKESEHAPELE